jgi:thiol-disulfide isomerase/thioredoxin
MLKPFFLLPVALLFLAAPAQAYEIHVKIDGLRDSAIFLGYRCEDKSYVVDTATLDRRGNAVFSKDKPLKKGVYLVVTPDKNYFEMLVTDNQKFSVSTKYSDLFGGVKFKGSPENQQFYDYQQYLREAHRRLEDIRKQKKLNEEGKKDSVAIYQKQLTDIERDIDAYIKALVKKNADNFLGTLLSAMLTVDVPEFDIPETVANKDSVRQRRAYEYRRDHYFDSFNFADNGLIRTPFLISNIDFFFEKVILPAPDTIIKYVDMLIGRARADDEMFQYITEHFFQRYQKSEYMGHDAVVVHLADKYYLSGEAMWATEKYRSEIKEYVDKMRHTLIGNTAPELLLPTNENAYVSLLKTPAEFTILCFWEPNCGHCKKELPRLWDVYQKFRDRGLVVFTVYTQYKRAEWDAYIADHPYDWIYAWDGVEAPGNDGKPTTFSVGSNFRKLYDIRSTPAVFLLDKDKKIIAKRMSVEILEKILNEEMKMLKK